jgi:CRISPR-associated protein Csm2
MPYPPNPSSRDRRPDAPAFQGPPSADIERIIVGGDVNLLVQWADKVGKELAQQRLTSSQIRNVFGTVRQIQLRWDKPGSATEPQAFRDAILLQPKLAYFAEREKRAKGGTLGMDTLQRVLQPALVLVGEGGQPRRERFERFAEFFEAIVAYHKKYGGN